MSRYVIDASVAVKWVIGEAAADQALRLRGHIVSAPELLIAECANIVWKKVRLGELTKGEASLAAGLLARSEIELVPMRSLARRAVELSIMLDHSAYDCIYLALAEEAGCPFVTADARLLRRLAAARIEAGRISVIELARFAD